jgi:hypothetical protein
MKDILYVSCALRDRPFNLQGRGHVLVFFVQKFFFGQHELEYLFFLSHKGQFFPPEINIRLYDKNSELFSSTKIRISFQQHWESEYFFRKKT